MFAIGEMNLDPDYFWDLTMADFIRKRYGYFQRLTYQWYHTRAIAFSNYRIMGGKDSIEKFWPMDGDTQELTDEQRRNHEDALKNLKQIKDFYNGRA